MTTNAFSRPKRVDTRQMRYGGGPGRRSQETAAGSQLHDHFDSWRPEADAGEPVRFVREHRFQPRENLLYDDSQISTTTGDSTWAGKDESDADRPAKIQRSQDYFDSWQSYLSGSSQPVQPLLASSESESDPEANIPTSSSIEETQYFEVTSYVENESLDVPPASPHLSRQVLEDSSREASPVVEMLHQEQSVDLFVADTAHLRQTTIKERFSVSAPQPEVRARPNEVQETPEPSRIHEEPMPAPKQWPAPKQPAEDPLRAIKDPLKVQKPAPKPVEPAPPQAPLDVPASTPMRTLAKRASEFKETPPIPPPEPEFDDDAGNDMNFGEDFSPNNTPHGPQVPQGVQQEPPRGPTRDFTGSPRSQSQPRPSSHPSRPSALGGTPSTPRPLSTTSRPQSDTSLVVSSEVQRAAAERPKRRPHGNEANPPKRLRKGTIPIDDREEFPDEVREQLKLPIESGFQSDMFADVLTSFLPHHIDRQEAVNLQVIYDDTRTSMACISMTKAGEIGLRSSGDTRYVFWVLAGRALVHVGGQALQVYRGGLFTVPPQTPYSVKKDSSAILRIVMLQINAPF